MKKRKKKRDKSSACIPSHPFSSTRSSQSRNPLENPNHWTCWPWLLPSSLSSQSPTPPIDGKTCKDLGDSQQDVFVSLFDFYLCFNLSPAIATLSVMKIENNTKKNNDGREATQLPTYITRPLKTYVKVTIGGLDKVFPVFYEDFSNGYACCGDEDHKIDNCPLMSEIKKPVCVKLEKKPYVGKLKKPMTIHPISQSPSTSSLTPYSKAPTVKIYSSHPEFLTYHPLKMLITPIPPTSHYPTETPMLPKDLGIGMALTSTPCASISIIPVMMTSLAFPEDMGLEFYLGQHQNILASVDGLRDEHSVTQILDIGKNEVDGQLPLEQIISQPVESRQKNLNFNDTVVKNMRQLDVDNSSSDGLFINSNDVKFMKREEDRKHNPKKKKNQKTSHPIPMP
ncbi:hypothetical protein Ancab_013375 [Ancistrocladus abbreviatus]